MDKSLLTKYTALAKDVIYDAGRMKKFLPMLGTPDGAVIAVKTVLGAIEQAKPIPPELARNLGVNTYLVLVDMAQSITEKQASPKIMKAVIGKILAEVDLTHGAQEAPQPGAQPPQQQPQPSGILAQGAM